MGSKKINPFDFDLKENVSSEELSKIQIFQNHALISLISYQTQSTIQAVFNNIVLEEYKNNLQPYVNLKQAEKKKSTKVLLNPENLKPEFKAQYDNLKKRLDEGEDISDSVKSLGFEGYFDL